MSAALIAAVRGRATEEVQRLLDAGADPSTREHSSGLTVLMIAAGQADPGTT